MTNTIVPGGSRPPPTPATKGAAHPAEATGDDALGFLALLALLGPRDAEATTATSDTTTTDATKGETDTVASTARHRGKRDGRDTDQLDNASGVVRAHPILPAPIILGVPPAAGDGRNWRAGDPTATTGAKGARPILPDALPSQRAGDVAAIASAEQSLGASSFTEGKIAALADAGQSLSVASIAKGKKDSNDAAPLLSAVASGNAATMTQASGGEHADMHAISVAQGGTASPNGALPFASTLPMAAPQRLAPQATSAPVPASAVSANGAPPAATNGATKRRMGNSDDAASEAGAFSVNDARLGGATTTGGTSSTAATTAPTHPAAMNAAREIVAQAQLVGRGESAEMRLRLRPPDLGEVGVTIRRNAAGALTVHLNPASPEAAAVLRAHLPHLQTALEPHSHGQGAQVTLGQHDASGSSHRQGGGDAWRGDDAVVIDTPATTRPTMSARTIRNAAIDYDA